LTVAVVGKRLEITDKTYDRWRKEYGGLKVDQAKRLKELEKENTRLKHLLAEAHLDKQMLQEIAGSIASSAGREACERRSKSAALGGAKVQRLNDCIAGPGFGPMGGLLF